MVEDYSKRMELPQLKSTPLFYKDRWDVPLFERRNEEQTPFEDITQVLLFEAKKSKDPVSTKQEEKLSEDYLYRVDEICAEVCK